MSINVCGRCHNRFGKESILDGTHGETIDGVWYCWNCARAIRNEKLASREARDREERERRYEQKRQCEQARENQRIAAMNQQQLLEQQERHHQEMLDATLPWFDCCHCGRSERQDRVRTVDGKKYCQSCGYKIEECAFCHKNYVREQDLILYFVNEKFDSENALDIAHGSFQTDYDDNGEFYNEICKTVIKACPSCLASYKESHKESFDKSPKNEAKFEQLKELKQEDEQFYEELAQQTAEIQQKIQNAKSSIAWSEAQREADHSMKRNSKKVFGGIFGLILLVAVSFIGNVFYDVPFGIAGISGLMLCISSYLLRGVTSRLFMGLFVGSILELIFGIPISVLWWWFGDAFLAPLGVCFIIFAILGAVAYSMGLTAKFRPNKSSSF